jgi:molecular chaperone GrpE (heat shock protein)
MEEFIDTSNISVDDLMNHPKVQEMLREVVGNVLGALQLADTNQCAGHFDPAVHSIESNEDDESYIKEQDELAFRKACIE